MLTRPEDRRDFLLAHYWDNYTFADTVLVNNRLITEQGFVNYISLLASPDTSDGLRAQAIDALCTGMEKQAVACQVFMQLMDDYLYNPNSPYYDEPLYAVYLSRMLRSEALDAARKSTLRFKLDLMSRNNPGSKAEDFIYFLPDGTRSSLRCTPVEGNCLLLVFYDPECPSCHEVMDAMMKSERLAQAVASRKLTVLAVYTEGDEEVWKSTLVGMPAGWIVGTDRLCVQDKALYDLKAMPSLYLLDGAGIVMAKDIPFEQVERGL